MTGPGGTRPGPVGRLGPLGFGAAPIGNLYTPVTDAEARDCVDAAWDHGVRYFDTAPHYGLGLSERRLGSALERRPRSEFVVSTKVGRLLEHNPRPTGSDMAEGFAVPDGLRRRRDYSGSGVLRSLDASRERLGLDRIDVVYVHDPEEHMDEALTEAVPALVELREQKVIGAVGVGMNAWRPLARFVQHSDIDLVMIAGRWTVLDRSAAPLLELCREHDVAVVAAAPFNSGLSATQDPPDDAPYDYGPAPADVLSRARSIARLCTRYGTTLPHAAMQFPVRHPAVAAVVAGMRSVDQVAAARRWMHQDVDPSLWPALDELR